MKTEKPVRIKNPFTDMVPFLDSVFDEEDEPEEVKTGPAKPEQPPTIQCELRCDPNRSQAANSSATKE